MKRDLENSITNYNDSVLAVYQVRKMFETDRIGMVLPHTSKVTPSPRIATPNAAESRQIVESPKSREK